MNQRDHQADYRTLAGSVQVSRHFRRPTRCEHSETAVPSDVRKVSDLPLPVKNSGLRPISAAQPQELEYELSVGRSHHRTSGGRAVQELRFPSHSRFNSDRAILFGDRVVQAARERVIEELGIGATAKTAQ
jgi:hypothetical protein